MPMKDGSGPKGEGPLTGRGFGSCKGKSFGFGRCERGLRRGSGFGRRFSFFFKKDPNIGLALLKFNF